MLWYYCFGSYIIIIRIFFVDIDIDDGDGDQDNDGDGDWDNDGDVVVIIGKKEEDCVDKYVGVSKEFDDVAKQVGKVVDDVTAVKEKDCGYTTFTINK